MTETRYAPQSAKSLNRANSSIMKGLEPPLRQKFPFVGQLSSGEEAPRPFDPTRRLIPRRIPLEHFKDHLRPFGGMTWFTKQTNACAHFLT